MQQPELLSFCRDHGIVVTSYGGLAPITREGGSQRFRALLDGLAEKYGVESSHVLQRWNLQGGKGVITTSTNRQRVARFFRTFTFTLTAEEMRAIDDAGAEAPQARHFWTKQHPPVAARSKI